MRCYGAYANRVEKPSRVLLREACRTRVLAQLVDLFGVRFVPFAGEVQEHKGRGSSCYLARSESALVLDDLGDDRTDITCACRLADLGRLPASCSRLHARAP